MQGTFNFSPIVNETSCTLENAMPTVRRFSERRGSRVVRINLRDHEISPRVGVGIASGAVSALLRVDDVLCGW
jgi:hypothetical protein